MNCHYHFDLYTVYYSAVTLPEILGCDFRFGTVRFSPQTLLSHIYDFVVF